MRKGLIKLVTRLAGSADAESSKAESRLLSESDLAGPDLAMAVLFEVGATFSVSGLDPEPRFYVYVHTDNHGNIFYVGKGTGDRAWNRDRDPLWRHYVQTRLNGEFKVQIVEEGLSEGEALRKESELMAELALQVVNRQNLGRTLDMAIHSHAAECRRRSEELEVSAALEEQYDLKVELFEQALRFHREANRASAEKGIVGQLLNELPPAGRTSLIVSLVECHLVEGNAEAAKTALERYLNEYTDHGEAKGIQALQRKVERYARGTARSRKPKRLSFVPPALLPADWERASEEGRPVIRLLRSLSLQGSHYTDTVPAITAMKRAGDYAGALHLLKAAMVATEEERPGDHRWQVAPWYFEQAAIVCSYLGNHLEECLVLSRYIHHPAAVRTALPKMLERLGKAASRLAAGDQKHPLGSAGTAL